MKIKNSTFIIGAVSEQQYPNTGYPEIALCGRSNVGKSSLINKLISRKNIARTSSSPGKTQQLNYYLIEPEEDKFYFVDLPGYGYARVSNAEREIWGQFIEKYLLDREECRLVLHVIDSRHAPTKDDVAMFQWLLYHERRVQVVATKIDKISRSKVDQHLLRIAKDFDIPKSEIIPVSSETGAGCEVLWEKIESILK